MAEAFDWTKQTTLEKKFFKKTSAGESSGNVGESSGNVGAATGNQSPEVTLLDDVMEGDSPSNK